MNNRMDLKAMSDAQMSVRGLSMLCANKQVVMMNYSKIMKEPDE